MYFVRTGVNGDVGVFRNQSHQRLQRDDRVVCETPRGLEIGSVLAMMQDETDFAAGEVPDPIGDIVRKVTPNDLMLMERLERYRDQAFTACQQLIASRQIPAILVDVEQLFDGENLFFYFLGPIDESLEQVLQELSSTYERRIRFRQFAERLATGCGPDCGTKDRGCGSSSGESSGCGSCGLSGACRSSAK